MDQQETLFTIAELSVALAGFSGVVVGLRAGRTRDGARQDWLGLGHILASTGVAMTFSLLPSAVAAAGVDAAAGHAAIVLALGLVVVAATGSTMAATRRTRPRHPVRFWTLAIVGAALGVACLAEGAGFLAPHRAFLPLTLVWTLLVAFVQFVTFLSLSWAPEE